MRALNILLLIIGMPLLFLGIVSLIVSTSLGPIIPDVYKLLDAISSVYSSYFSVPPLTNSIPNSSELYGVGIIFALLGIGGTIGSDYRGKGLVYAGLVIFIGAIVSFGALGIELLTFPSAIYNALSSFNVNISESQIVAAGYLFLRNTVVFIFIGVVMTIVGAILNRHFKNQEEKKKKEEELEQKKKEDEDLIKQILAQKENTLIINPNNEGNIQLNQNKTEKDQPSSKDNAKINGEDNPFRPI
ncbi:MAG: hypothetical protein QXP36_04110 [Conexivisphaerales archaeon]